MSKLGFGFVLMAVLAFAMPGQTFADGHEAGEAEAAAEGAADATEDVSAPPAEEGDATDTDSEGAEEGEAEEAQPE